MDLPGQILLVAVLGVLTGLTELFSRYGARSRYLLVMPVAVPLVLVNALAGVLLLLVLPRLSWAVAPSESLLATDALVVNALTAWILGAAFLRSSLFVYRIGTQDVAIGPAALHQILLATADRAIDHLVASSRSVGVSRLMATIDFDEAKVALPVYCLTLLKNATQETQVFLADEINRLDQAPIAANVKSLSLGLLLADAVGDDILRAGIEALQHSRSTQPSSDAQVSARAVPSTPSNDGGIPAATIETLAQVPTGSSSATEHVTLLSAIQD